MTVHDAIVVGSGPNGLAAAIELARHGWKVAIYEASSQIGGGARTLELTLPGFKHDICSAIHPLGISSPFFTQLPLERYGLEWCYPEVQVGHPLEDSAAVIYTSLERTCDELGQDGGVYRRLFEPLVNNWDSIADFILGPFRIPADIVSAVQFGIRALPPTTWLTDIFQTQEAKGLFAGLAAHSLLPMEHSPSAAVGLVLGSLAHAVGWGLPKGGSQQIVNSLADYFCDLGGEIICDSPVTSLDMLPSATAYLLSVTPRQLLDIAGNRLPAGFYKHQLKNYRYNPGVYKVDYALSEPIPWRDMRLRKAGTVHVGGTLREIAHSERLAWEGIHCDKPYVLVAQQSIVDDTRTPDEQHTGWAYCHVPHGSTRSMEDAITSQIERFAPGFRDCILATHTMQTDDLQAYNMNYIGGDINGGVQDWLQLFTRPAIKARPYTTPIDGVYLCSSSTPPGGGVHGMCGYHAARAVLWDYR